MNRGLQRGLVLLAALVVGWVALRFPSGEPLLVTPPGPRTGPAAPAPDAGSAVAGQVLSLAANGTMQRVGGRVTRILTDDRDGSRHQRFIIALDSGTTLLIAHNIDLAPRLDGLAVGEAVEVYGEYEWNEQGGLLHWTHKDPAGNHPAGHIEWRGRRYQ
jgi:hypothetical protein